MAYYATIAAIAFHGAHSLAPVVVSDVPVVPAANVSAKASKYDYVEAHKCTQGGLWSGMCREDSRSLTESECKVASGILDSSPRFEVIDSSLEPRLCHWSTSSYNIIFNRHESALGFCYEDERVICKKEAGWNEVCLKGEDGESNQHCVGGTCTNRRCICDACHVGKECDVREPMFCLWPSTLRLNDPINGLLGVLLTACVVFCGAVAKQRRHQDDDAGLGARDVTMVTVQSGDSIYTEDLDGLTRTMESQDIVEIDGVEYTRAELRQMRDAAPAGGETKFGGGNTYGGNFNS